MTEAGKGILALIACNLMWGFAPIFFKQLSHIPSGEVLAHRAIWSFVIFAGLLALQGRLGALRAALSTPRRIGILTLAMVMVSANWFLFIYATALSRNTETSLGYYILPLMAVALGRLVFGERLGRMQALAVALAALAVALLSAGQGALPWISLVLASTFALYSVIKKTLDIGPVVSVTAEVILFLPIALAILWQVYATGPGAFGQNLHDSVFLMLSGVQTALPLIFFSYAARRVRLVTVGLMQYLNPTCQFFCAVVLYGEALTLWHGLAFPLIWTALALYTLSALAQDRASRRAARAAAASGTTVRNPASEASANP